MKKLDQPFLDSALRLRDGGGLHGVRPSIRESVINSLAPAMDVVGPYIDKAREFNEQYPAVGQAAQTFIPAVNVAAGAAGIAQAVNDRDLGAGIAAGAGMVPVVGKYAKRAVLAGTNRTIDQARFAIQNGGISSDLVKTAIPRISGDAAVGMQAYQMGDSTYDTTKTLRGEPPGPFYGGNPHARQR